MRVIASAIWIVCIASACSDEGTAAGDSTATIIDDSRDGVSGDTKSDAAGGRNETFDLNPDGEVTSEVDTTPGGGFGAACQANADCESGWCVESAAGYVCTNECLEACPTDFDCKSVQNAKGDVTFLCLPRLQKLCVPCLEDFQCNGGACLVIDGSEQCASGCDADDDCPQGYACTADATGAKSGSYCQPKSGSCECSQGFAGVRRTCTTENELGTCYGVETCDPEVGWAGCSARTAVPEQCDYVDNDCDGDVDEDFKSDGIYASVASCGSCTTSCDEVLANAGETACTLLDGSVRCHVISCKPGFNLVNPYVCAPDAGNLCQPCESAAACIGTGAACTPLEDGSYCTRGCVADTNCPEGFSCTDAPAGKQCIPTSGSCTCDGTNTDLARACRKTLTAPDPGATDVICKGFELCTAAGWGACDLPDDLCDGIDNDCDGVVDGPYKTAGRYTAVEHCGACDISCLVLERPNAVPACDASGAVPTCGIRCVGDAVDVNGESNDGCECLPTLGDDLAGDDVDSNCDGVDGEVDNAIFVSKDGADDNPGTRELPLRSVPLAIAKAKADNKRDVYVATGVFSESLVLADGVGVFGGYSPEFDAHDALVYETALIGTAADAPRIGTVTASDLGATTAARETVLDGFTIFGVAAGNSDGGNSYAVYIKSSGPRLRLSHNRIFGGPAGNGNNGNRGSDGNNGAEGAVGTGAHDLPADCIAAQETLGGLGGARLCGQVGPAPQTDASGGNGGKAVCPNFEVSPADFSRGSNGKGSGAGYGGSYGWPMLICASDAGTSPTCDAVACTVCRLPLGGKPYTAYNGTNGNLGNNGSKGSAGGGNGTTSSGQWVGNNGTDGGAGTHGSGGGGGGAGGGVEVEGLACDGLGNDDVGGSGGGGGSGGCLGTGGTGGSAGGGSFGIFIAGTTTAHVPRIFGNSIQAGRGATGGAGGAGGVGGAAGRGGRGGYAGEVQGSVARCSQGGGDGGNGGGGGHGGGGGGGAGGPSYAIYSTLASGISDINWKLDNSFFAGGGGGAGGAGGVSVEQSRSGGAGANGPAANTNF